MPADESPVAVAAGGALLLLFGGGLMVAFARRLLRVWASRKWIATPCEVLSIRAVGVEDYSIEIAYAYRVGETTYQSARFSFADNLSVANAHDFVARHPPGSTAVCYVNPNDPADAVFVRSVNVTGAALLFVTGAVTATCGAFLMYLWATGKFGAN